MNGPSFLTSDEVLLLHLQSLRNHGGTDGIREPGLVDSALASAQNIHWYTTGDLFDIAASYAFHLAESQAFLDGNKRTVIAAALTFLKINGIPAHPNSSTQDRLYDAMIALATKDLDKAGLAALFREVFS